MPNPNNSWSWVTYTYVFNLTKNPSCSIPCGVVDGLPVGLMVTGPLYDDLGVLRACRAYEAAAGPVWPSPELAASLTRIASAARRGGRREAVDAALRDVENLRLHRCASAAYSPDLR